jgi:FAD-linked oxidoreductase
VKRRHVLRTLAAGSALPALGASKVAAQSAPAAASVANATAVPQAARAWRNWSGLQSCQPQRWVVPANESELAATMKDAVAPLRCVGAGHSFSGLVPTDGTLLSLDRFNGTVNTDAAKGVMRLGAGIRVGAAAQALHESGLAFTNLPDIDVQTLAGALGTATHGTGATLKAMQGEVSAMTLITSRGERVECSAQRQPDVFAAAKVSLGALGALTEVSIQARPRFVLRRSVRLMPVQLLLEQADALALKHLHFEFYLLPFTGYGAVITHDEVNTPPQPRAPSQDESVLADLRRLRDLLGRFPSARRWVAQRLIDADLTEQAVDWSHKLLTTVRPTRFNESEFHVPREQGIACVREVLATLEKRNEVFFPIEFRYVAADDAWLSPFYQRASCSIAVHAAHDEPWDYLVRDIGAIFRRYKGRPHWGKLHDYTVAELRAAYPRWDDFQRVRRELDPQGRMLNPNLARLFGAA